jgi:hypothetical protein
MNEEGERVYRFFLPFSNGALIFLCAHKSVSIYQNQSILNFICDLFCFQLTLSFLILLLFVLKYTHTHTHLSSSWSSAAAKRLTAS